MERQVGAVHGHIRLDARSGPLQVVEVTGRHPGQLLPQIASTLEVREREVGERTRPELRQAPVEHDVLLTDQLVADELPALVRRVDALEE